jgi:hypothetical protein
MADTQATHGAPLKSHANAARGMMFSFPMSFSRS